MFNKLLNFFSTIFLIAAPLIVWSEQVETKISADVVTAKPDGVLYAQGNVTVQYGSIYVKAKALSFNQQTNSINFKEIVEFYDGQAIKFSASEADINRELSEGIVRAAKLVLDETINIRAEEIRLSNGEISKAKGITRVTSCEECEGQEPNWYLTASSAKRDFENSNIVYRNVTVRVKGLPIAYVPYLRMPDPTVDRARGFLVPEAAITSNLGTGLKIPYFVPMGTSRDLLFTPYFSSKTNTLEYRYRQKFTRGDLIVDGAFSSDDAIKSELRYFSKAKGSFQLQYGIDLNFDLGKVGDNSYLGDYVYSEESDFNSEIMLSKKVVDKEQFFEGHLKYLKEKEQGSSLDEYFALSGSYVKDISSVKLPGKLRVKASLNSALNVNDDNSFSRPPSSAQVGFDYTQINYGGPFQIDHSLFGDFSSFVNSADAGNTNEEFSLKYGASSQISVPYVKYGKGFTQILTPKIAVSINHQENDILGDFFIGADELTFGNVYSGKKITSLTESEQDLSVSIGFEQKVFWDSGHQMGLSIAAAKLGGLTYAPTLNYGFTNEKLNYLGSFSFMAPNRNNISAQSFLSENGHLLYGDLKGKSVYKKLDLSASYEFIDEEMDSRLSEDLKTLGFTSSYQHNEAFEFDLGGRYDFAVEEMASTSIGLGFSLGSWQYRVEQEYLKQEQEKTSISAIYDDNCTRLTFSFENRYQDLGSSEPVKSLTLRVQLKPFAKFVVSQGADQITF